jgi:hypothetical protein
LASTITTDRQWLATIALRGGRELFDWIAERRIQHPAPGMPPTRAPNLVSDQSTVVAPYIPLLDGFVPDLIRFPVGNGSWSFRVTAETAPGAHAAALEAFDADPDRHAVLEMADVLEVIVQEES